MPSLNENDIENLAIELLQKQGYRYIYGPDIAPAGDNAERKSYAQMLLGRLRDPLTLQLAVLQSCNQRPSNVAVSRASKLQSAAYKPL